MEGRGRVDAGLNQFLMGDVVLQNLQYVSAQVDTQDGLLF